MPVIPITPAAPGEPVSLDSSSRLPAIDGSQLTSISSTGAFSLSGVITPASIGADQNNYNPSGLSSASTLRLAATTPGFNITGLSGGSDGRLLSIHNIGSFPIILIDESTNSTAANRFALAGDKTISPNNVCIIQYDNTSSRWRGLSGGGAPSGNAGGDLTGSTYPNPVIAPLAVTASKIANATITDTQVATANKDGAAGTASLRTLGTGAAQACAGNDSRLSDSRTPNGAATGDLAGSYPSPTVAQSSTAFALTGVITPTTIASDANDYAPTGLSTASLLRLSASTPGFNITGLTGGASGRILTLHNIGSFPITLVDESSGSTAGNRFALESNLVLSVDSCCFIQYDNTATRWRVVGASRVAYGSAANTICQGNDARLSDARTPTAHASTHLPANADPLTTAAAGTLSIGSAAAVGTANSFARSDHVHGITAPAAPVNVTKASANAGTGTNAAREDHKHDVTTAAPAATGVATASGEGSATSLARSDHSHQSNTAPVNVTKASAAIGTSGEPARADHKHDITTATASSNPPGTTNAEGTATSLARSDHTHALAAFGAASTTFCEGNDPRLSFRVVRVASTANISSLSTLLTIDGVSTASGDRILVKNQTTASQNGIYTAASGSWALAPDWITGAVIAEQTIKVSEGTTQAHTLWSLTTQGVITVGTTSLTFTQFTGGSTNPGGSTTQVQYNSAGAFAGAANTVIDAGGYPNIGEATSSTPSLPSAGVTTFARYRAGRRMLAQIGPSGIDYSFQPCLFGNKIGLWTSQGNGTTSFQINYGNSVTGTATARNVATTNLATSLRQLAYVSAATAGSSAGTRHNLAQFYRGDAAGRGGFFNVVRFVVDTVQTNMRWFVGLLNATAVIGNVNPSTLTNMFGFGIDSGQTTVRFFNNDSSGTATATDLGTNFPATTAAVVYETRLFSPPNGSNIFYSIQRFDADFLSEGSVSTDIPTNTTLLSPQIWMNNGSTAAAVAISVISQYIETDN